MRVLVACEESQRVCIAFRMKGHEAYSCDLQKPSGRHTEWHIVGDCQKLINGNCIFQTMDGTEHVIEGKWDLLIPHPPCTYLSSVGSCNLFNADHSIKNHDRERLMWLARDFFMRFLEADCERIAVENPAPMHYCKLPVYTQIIEPYMFGHPWKKRTCLWLKNLPQLRPTNIVEPTSCWVHTSGRTSRTKLHGARGAVSKKDRSKTFIGIAMSMAEQWG